MHLETELGCDDTQWTTCSAINRISFTSIITKQSIIAEEL